MNGARINHQQRRAAAAAQPHAAASAPFSRYPGTPPAHQAARLARSSPPPHFRPFPAASSAALTTPARCAPAFTEYTCTRRFSASGPSSAASPSASARPFPTRARNCAAAATP